VGADGLRWRLWLCLALMLMLFLIIVSVPFLSLCFDAHAVPGAESMSGVFWHRSGASVSTSDIILFKL